MRGLARRHTESIIGSIYGELFVRAERRGGLERPVTPAIIVVLLLAAEARSVEILIYGRQAIERIINMFRPDLRKQLFLNLSFNLRALISQRLVNGTDGKRKAAVEVMINTPYIAELLLNGRIEEIKEALENSGERGMQSFDTALFNLYREGEITLEEALSHADSRNNLEAKINFG